MASDTDTLQDQETYSKVGEDDTEAKKKKKLRQIMKLYVMCDKHYRMHFLSSIYFKHKRYVDAHCALNFNYSCIGNFGLCG